RRHTRFSRDWSSDVCSSDLMETQPILINPVTHLTYDRVRVLLAQGETFADAISIAEQELQVALGIGLPDLEINEPGTSLNILGEIGRASCREREYITEAAA